MRKADVQRLYKEVKRNKFKVQRNSRSLFDEPKSNKSGCRTCGKVTWKPY